MSEQMLTAHQQLLVEHLPYELDMFEWSYTGLHDDRFVQFRQHPLILNLLIESFWTHARNLVEFFNQPRNGSEVGVASASDFIKSGRFDPPFEFQALMQEINTQVSHLQYHRTSAFEEKLNSTRMDHVRGAINKAVRLFEANLSDAAKAVWRPRQPLQITVNTMTMAACTVISSTASIGSMSVIGPGPTSRITAESA